MVSVFGGIVLLVVLVIIHEMGHFLVAKAVGVRVLTFSVGFGPKLLGFTWRDTEYRFSAIPLGGYVRMYGESYSDELEADQKHRSFIHQPLWKKAAIAVAGPLFNLFLPVFLFACVFFGNETFIRPVVGTVIPGEPAALAGFLASDRITSINDQPVVSFTDMVATVSAHPGQPLRFGVEREQGGKQSALTLQVTPSRDPDTNPLREGQEVGHIGILAAYQKPIIDVVGLDSAAAKAGLKTFDEVISVNGVAVHTYPELMAQLSQGAPWRLQVKRKDAQLAMVLQPQSAPPARSQLAQGVARFAVTENEIQGQDFERMQKATQAAIDAFVASAPLGIAFSDAVVFQIDPNSTATSVGLMPNDRIVAIDGKAVFSWAQVQQALEAAPSDMHLIGVLRNGQAQLMAFRLKAIKDPDAPIGAPARRAFGVQPGDVFAPAATGTRFVGVSEALKRGLSSTWDLVLLTVESIKMLLSARVSMDEVGGPIMIFSVAGYAVRQGLDYYIYVMSLISINLGLLNLLPIPILDGGHLMIFGIEAVQRRPIKLKTRQILTQVGMLFILALMVLAMVNDLSRLMG